MNASSFESGTGAELKGPNIIIDVTSRLTRQLTYCGHVYNYEVTVLVGMSGKSQHGLRIDGDVWSGYSNLCHRENVWPGEGVERFMKRVVEVGSVQKGLSSLSLGPQSVLADAVSVKRMLVDLDRLVCEGFLGLDEWKTKQSNDYFPDVAGRIDELVDRLLAIISRLQDEALAKEAAGWIQRAVDYANFERQLKTSRSRESMWLEQIYHRRFLRKQKVAEKSTDESAGPGVSLSG